MRGEKMIRSFNMNDKAEILDRLKSEEPLEVDAFEKEVADPQNRIIVFDDNGIKGFGLSRLSEEETRRVDFYIYVFEGFRNKGIGSKLYESVSEHIETLKPNTIVTKYTYGNHEQKAFLKKRGYKNWFGSNAMEYTGGKQPFSHVEFLPYKEKHFEAYENLVHDSFYELFKTSDIQPYKQDFEESYKRKLIDKYEIYMVFEDKELIASIMLNKGVLNMVMVSPKCQGQGLGRIIMNFAINKCIDDGFEKIKLGCIMGNTNAEKLYLSIGFEIVDQTVYCRQFGERSI